MGAKQGAYAGRELIARVVADVHVTRVGTGPGSGNQPPQVQVRAGPRVPTGLAPVDQQTFDLRGQFGEIGQDVWRDTYAKQSADHILTDHVPPSALGPHALTADEPRSDVADERDRGRSPLALWIDSPRRRQSHTSSAAPTCRSQKDQFPCSRPAGHNARKWRDPRAPAADQLADCRACPKGGTPFRRVLLEIP